jgi:hypothetical protein
LAALAPWECRADMAAAKMFACLFVSSYIHDDAFCLSAFFFFSVVLPHRFIRVSFVSRVYFGSHFEFFPVVFSAFLFACFVFSVSLFYCLLTARLCPIKTLPHCLMRSPTKLSRLRDWFTSLQLWLVCRAASQLIMNSIDFFVRGPIDFCFCQKSLHCCNYTGRFIKLFRDLRGSRLRNLSPRPSVSAELLVFFLLFRIRLGRWRLGVLGSGWSTSVSR